MTEDCNHENWELDKHYHFCPDCQENVIVEVLPSIEPCPFCGDAPDLPDGNGTQYEIWCSCGMALSAVQICDLMTIEEKQSDSFAHFRYGEQYISRAAVEAIRKWNSRA